MAKNKFFDLMKNEGLVTAPLDKYLWELNEENDRRYDINSPSQISACMRALYYSRMGFQKDAGAIDPRLRRIFDNGTGVHERLQRYLLEEGILEMDEVPLRNDYYNIQGSTDGYIRLSKDELAILEIKSIKMENFQKLKDAEEHHKEQSSIYMFCAESRRQYLRKTYKTLAGFMKSRKARERYFEKVYDHLVDGKRTREEKIKAQVYLCMKSDMKLYTTKNPINKIVVLYECKNSQNLKEFVVTWHDETIDPLLQKCLDVNEAVENEAIPEREGTKSSMVCRYCSYRTECHIV